MKIKTNSKKKRNIALAILAAVVLVGAGTAYAAVAKVGPFASKETAELHKSNSENDTQSDDDQSKQDSQSSDSQDISQSAEQRVKNGGGSGQGSEKISGGVTDTKGDTKKQSGGTRSTSGNITLYSPTSGQKISGSTSVSGAASGSTVFYRISDNERGMINSGQLSVNNGLFSGSIAVSTDASNGTFEVYHFNSEGQEIDNVKVGIKY